MYSVKQSPFHANKKHFLLSVLLVLSCGYFKGIEALDINIELCIDSDLTKPAVSPEWIWKQVELPRNPLTPWLPPARVPVWVYQCRDDNQLQRKAILHIPGDNPNNAKDRPLVMNLHALGANAFLQQQVVSKLDLTADRPENNFVVLYPEGYAKFGSKRLEPFLNIPNIYAFNAGGCCSYEPIDEIGFFRKLIEYVENEYQTKQEQVYVTGMSNGGFMTNRVACEMSDIIAAAAPVAGVLMEKYDSPRDPPRDHPLGWGVDPFVCNPENPVPLLHIHSTKDEIVPFLGSENGEENQEFQGLTTLITGDASFSPSDLGFPSANTSTDKWRNFNNLDIKEVGEKISRKDSTCTLYSKPKSGSEDDFAKVELCVHQSSTFFGHCWPGKVDKDDLSVLPDEVQNLVNLLPEQLLPILNIGLCGINDVNNQYIWDFFKGYTRDREDPVLLRDEL